MKSSNIWSTLTFKNDERVLAKAVELHEKLVEEMKGIVPNGDFITLCMFQPLSLTYSKHSVSKGGNVLGLDKAEEPLVLWLATLAVRDARQEAIGREKVIAWKNAVEDFAKSVGAHDKFIYLDYANEAQDPLRSYGVENVNFMKAVAAKYDPEGIFQTRCPGGFKISKVADVNTMT
jgi:hypothetical protein